MFEIESVLMDSDETLVEEYLDESEQQQSSQEAKQESPPKRKIPIIRRPGEFVTPPVINRRPAAIKVSPSAFTPNSSVSRAVLSGRGGTTWQRVTPHGVGSPAPKVITARPSGTAKITPTKVVVAAAENSDEEDVADDDRSNGFEQVARRIKKEPAPSVGKVTLESLDAKLNALDAKLNRIVAKLGEHDGALKAVKYHVKDLRIELTNIRESRVEQAQARAPKRRRQPLITFPVTDDNHLMRLEELVQADNDIREELCDRYLEAPGSDVYHYLRKNVGYLFNNTSKYTWTGKPPNNAKDKNPSGVARLLTVVDVLIDSGCEKFHGYSRGDMEVELKRALERFNGARLKRLNRREQSVGGNSGGGGGNQLQEAEGEDGENEEAEEAEGEEVEGEED